MQLAPFSISLQEPARERLQTDLNDYEMSTNRTPSNYDVPVGKAQYYEIPAANYEVPTAEAQDYTVPVAIASAQNYEVPLSSISKVTDWLLHCRSDL